MTPHIFVGLQAYDQERFNIGANILEPKDILDIACIELGIKREDVLGLSRKRAIVECRHIAIGVMRLNSLYTLMKIGELMNRHHATVMHAIDNFKDLYGRDKEFTRKVNMVKTKTNKL